MSEVSFSLNHSHMVNFLFCYAFIDGHAVGVSWKWPICIKIFLEEKKMKHGDKRGISSTWEVV